MTQTTAAAMTNTTITGATNRTITGTRTGGWWSRRPWLGMFLGGLGLWMATVAVTFVTQNPNLVPTIILLGSFLVPVTFVAYTFGSADQVVTTQQILTAFVYGGALGVLGASVLEAAFLKSPSPVTYLYVGLIEEAVKLAALWLVARRLPRYSMRDGIVLGAAVGFGFAAFESAGFAFNALFTSSGLSLINVVETEVLRGILAPVGHGLWDAAQPIAVWLTLVLTGTQVQWQLLRLGQVPAVTQTQVHLFTFLNWGLLIVDALIGLWVLRGRWRQVTTPDRREPTAPDRPGILAAVVPVSAESRQQ